MHRNSELLTGFKMVIEDGMTGHHPPLPALSLVELWAYVLELSPVFTVVWVLLHFLT